VVVELVVIQVNQVEQEIVHQLVHHKEIMEEMVIRQEHMVEVEEVELLL
jgi:hypothetical protein